MKKFLYFDSHCHMNHNPLKEEFDSIYSTAKEKGVNFNIIGTNLKDSFEAIKLASQYEGVYCSIGIHPNDVKFHNIMETEEELRKMLKSSNKIIAIGETGLDYYYTTENKEDQLAFLRMHFKLAKEFSLPLQLHIRGEGAFTDIKNFIRNNNSDGIKFIIHCFSGSTQDIEELKKFNCYFSFSGIVTFKNSKSLQEAAACCPIDRIIAETDSPWLSPEPERGKVNNPIKVIYVYEKLLKLNSQLTSEIINTNIKLLFNIK